MTSTAADTKSTAHDEDSILDGPRFNPALYIQRYQFVHNLLYKENPPIRRVSDFGCAEGRFLVYLKKLPFAEEINAVDVAREALEQTDYHARPIVWDYTFGRNVQLNLSLYKGSVAEPDHRMLGLDAITCVELIEHLPADVLEKFPENVFGYWKPRIVVVTTPNSEFNVLFPQLKRDEFRHWDHKFEWTRAQFRHWCNSVVQKYPDYTYEVAGVGDPPQDRAHVGHCTQIAVFRRTQNFAAHNSTLTKPTSSYVLVNSYTYPKRDKKEEKFVEFDWNGD